MSLGAVQFGVMPINNKMARHVSAEHNGDSEYLNNLDPNWTPNPDVPKGTCKKFGVPETPLLCCLAS